MTTATIPAEYSVEDNLTDEELAAEDDVILKAMLAEWSDGDEDAKRIAFNLKVILFFGDEPMTGHRRPSHKARSMRRSGRRYQVRKDHGTTAEKRQREAENAKRSSRKKNSRRSQSKLAKLEAHKGNERAIAKLKRNGDLLVD